MRYFIVVERDKLEPGVIKAFPTEEVKVIVLIVYFNVIAETSSDSLDFHLFEQELTKSYCIEN